MNDLTGFCRYIILICLQYIKKHFTGLFRNQVECNVKHLFVLFSFLPSFLSLFISHSYNHWLTYCDTYCNTSINDITIFKINTYMLFTIFPITIFHENETYKLFKLLENYLSVSHHNRYFSTTPRICKLCRGVTDIH